MAIRKWLIGLTPNVSISKKGLSSAEPSTPTSVYPTLKQKSLSSQKAKLKQSNLHTEREERPSLLDVTHWDSRSTLIITQHNM
jgi:hypothetical protein